jgi:purine-nucleoside phosphorylase
MDDKVLEAVAELKNQISDQPQIGIILGSGLGGLVDEIDNPVSVRFEDIPHFPVSSVAGHRGEVLCGTLCSASLLVLCGRVHYYEGYPMQQVAFPVRVLAAFGVKTLMVTNAVGAINADYKPGDIVAIQDHINLMGANPLKGSNDFVDLSEAYSRELRNLARQMADRQGITLRTGVYAAYSGPSYETPAEIRALRIMGADMVGMSTVPEVIQANSLGLKVLGLSMITNMAAGMSAEPLSHEDVIKTSNEASAKFSALVKAIIGELEQRSKT